MSKSHGNHRWVLFFLVIVAVAAYFYASNKPLKDTEIQKEIYQTEKTGAGVVVNYSTAAKNIHTVVDKALAQTKAKIENIEEAPREVARQQVEGSIRWHVRQILVKFPVDTKVEIIEQAIATALKGVHGEILDIQPDTYMGMTVMRIDAGIRDVLAGAPLTLITDHIYVSKEQQPGTTGEEERAANEQATVVGVPGVTGRGVLAIVIDDFGYSNEAIEAFAAIPRPLTFSVLPYKAYSNEAAARGLSSGHQVMLHLPMEPLSGGEQSEATTVTVNMSDTEIQRVVSNAIEAVPGVVGVNNHQGSRATADKRVMRSTLEVIKANNLFFVDSRTNGASVASSSAHQMGVRIGENDLFIDNQSDVGYIKGQIRKAIHMAVNNGSVTIIGHARLHTATAIREMIPEIEAAGIRLVFESQLVR
ncbi:MAG: protein of unknown function YibQ [Firmicutes bacterium]|nr:protein of unknown function YibQ [Bacillota bacterium]